MDTKTTEDVKTEASEVQKSGPEQKSDNVKDTDKMQEKPEKAQSSVKKEQSNRKKKSFKIIVIGDTGVGKTCLTYRFCSGKFPTTPTDATIGVDFREKIVTLDNNEQVSKDVEQLVKIHKSLM